jgi:maleylacetoacetate isomerase
MRLHTYYRSSASWRVRIALNLKGVAVEQAFHHLRKAQQRAPEYLCLHPQGLVPALELNDGATVLTQSVAICEWLDEMHPEPPLLPGSALERARIRAFALAIACDIHPVQNLKVLARLRSMSLPESDVTGWARWIIEDGLAACEALLARTPGPFCFGQTPHSPTSASCHSSTMHAASRPICMASPGCSLPSRPATRCRPLCWPRPSDRATLSDPPESREPDRTDPFRETPPARSRGAHIGV